MNKEQERRIVNWILSLESIAGAAGNLSAFDRGYYWQAVGKDMTEEEIKKLLVDSKVIQMGRIRWQKIDALYMTRRQKEREVPLV